MSPRRPPRPVPTANERQVEELGRQLAAGGATVQFQPTVAHRLAAGPAAWTCLAAAAAAVLGQLWPLAGIAVLLLVLWGAVRDIDGGRSWLRRMLPAAPGWAAEVELQSAPPDAPTLALWIPVTGRAHPRITHANLARALFALPASLGMVACLGLALAPFAPQAGRGVAAVAAAGLALCAPAALLVLRPPAELPAAADPSRWLPGLARRLGEQPVPGVRVLVWLGSEGAIWHDDLAVVLASRRHRYDPRRTVLIAVQPGAAPLAVAAVEGLLHLRPAPASLAGPLQAAGIPLTRGRTGAGRARAMGLPAIGLVGTGGEPGQAPHRLEAALRCLAGATLPSPPEPA